MRGAHAVRIASASIAGIAVGTVLAAVLLVLLLLAVVDLFSVSGAEHARREAQSQFGKVATVGSCRKVANDPLEPEYRCAVTAPRCTRSYLFVLSHELGAYAIAPAANSDVIFERPCSIPSDR